MAWYLFKHGDFAPRSSERHISEFSPVLFNENLFFCVSET